MVWVGLRGLRAHTSSPRTWVLVAQPIEAPFICWWVSDSDVLVVKDSSWGVGIQLGRCWINYEDALL